MRKPHRLTAAQYDTIRLAALRPSHALEPLPSYIRGAARQSVLAALIASGYAARCYFPGHIEYALTESGLARYRAESDCAQVQGASGAPVPPPIPEATRSRWIAVWR